MRNVSIGVALAAIALTGCEPTKIGPGAETRASRAEADAQAREKAELAAHPVRLPPAIRSSRSYRCADGSVLLVDWMTDGLTARASTDAKGPQTTLSAAAADAPKTAEGWSLSGSATDGKVTASTPAHPKAMSCHV